MRVWDGGGRGVRGVGGWGGASTYAEQVSRCMEQLAGVESTEQGNIHASERTRCTCPVGPHPVPTLGDGSWALTFVLMATWAYALPFS